MNFKLKRIDWYIIKQFLGTYVFAIILIISISVVFDINEKIDKFLKPDVPLQAIILDYYMNFIPYFANLFSPLFTFIAVIFFTSKLADNSEIIAMLASGMKFPAIDVALRHFGSNYRDSQFHTECFHHSSRQQYTYRLPEQVYQEQKSGICPEHTD